MCAAKTKDRDKLCGDPLQDTNTRSNVPVSNMIQAMKLSEMIIDGFFCSFTEKVTKYCDELGHWVQTGSTCQRALKNKSEVFGCRLKGSQPQMVCSFIQRFNFSFFFCSQKEILLFLRDAAGELSAEPAEKGGVMEIILENEKKCSEKMKEDPPYNKSGTATV